MRVLVSMLFILCVTLLTATEPVGVWTFDNANDPTAATVGHPLVLQGTHSIVNGPTEGDGAIAIDSGSYYQCTHDIDANGDHDTFDNVNKYTIVIDFLAPTVGQWRCFFQTNPANTNDGDAFINLSSHIGVAATGYSYDDILPNEWYRLAISVNLGVHYDYYLDGQLLQAGGVQDYDGRFSLTPRSGDNTLLFFADDDGEDNLIECASIKLYDTDLSAEEIAGLGGYGHTVHTPDNIAMATYLSMPTPNGIRIAWHDQSATGSQVEYGLTSSLGQTATGTVTQFTAEAWWHTVSLSGLTPDTRYFYRVTTGSDVSDVRTFRTPPANDADNHIRFAVYADNQTNPQPHNEMVHAIMEKSAELFGGVAEDNLNLVLSAGDIVANGADFAAYRNEFFTPIAPLSMNVPYQAAIGNHELESPIYYAYMDNTAFAGPEGAYYYSFRIGRVVFLMLDTNLQGDTQLNWLTAQLEAAQSDPTVAMVFVTHHQPGHSEIWPDGNVAYSQNEIKPILAQYDKVAFVFNGHTHAYERGAHPEAGFGTMIVGGGGGDLDRWGMYDNQTNYPDTWVSLDQHCYAIFDVDPVAGTYIERTYSLGNESLPRNNQLVDSCNGRIGAVPDAIPQAVYPTTQAGTTPSLVASVPDTGIASVNFQLQSAGGDWTNPLFNSRIDRADVYGDTGSPNWTPTDLNASTDLCRCEVTSGLLAVGGHYEWRARLRSSELAWSEWSEPMAFMASGEVPAARFVASATSGDAPLSVRFFDTTDGHPTAWEWDFDSDGTVDAMTPSPTHVFTAAGNYTVTLRTVVNGSILSCVREQCITVTGASTDDPVHSESPTLMLRNNPFRDTSTIQFSLPAASRVSLSVFNTRGQRIRTLVQNRMPGGQHRITWDGRDDDNRNVGSGVYLIRLETGKTVTSTKCVLLR
jgi:PKD repeat protein